MSFFHLLINLILYIIRVPLDHPNIDPSLADLLSKMLEKDPESRIELEEIKVLQRKKKRRKKKKEKEKEKEKKERKKRKRVLIE